MTDTSTREEIIARNRLERQIEEVQDIADYENFLFDLEKNSRKHDLCIAVDIFRTCATSLEPLPQDFIGYEAHENGEFNFA
ncbi:hypothetical protein [Sulfitobacter sp. W074]|uniref:hypothetical protein n=1 Tax=Sulfitobacter sp. W074 TaxID=2867026 RepID=UPI0021A5780A|nr:hypothetical protein [Sulfitobacter sp. W074]UWR38367.1 hypothetical protein K3762_04870 [Sulfitobacter sp. W074]